MVYSNKENIISMFPNWWGKLIKVMVDPDHFTDVIWFILDSYTQNYHLSPSTPKER